MMTRILITLLACATILSGCGDSLDTRSEEELTAAYDAAFAVNPDARDLQKYLFTREELGGLELAPPEEKFDLIPHKASLVCYPPEALVKYREDHYTDGLLDLVRAIYVDPEDVRYEGDRVFLDGAPLAVSVFRFTDRYKVLEALIPRRGVFGSIKYDVLPNMCFVDDSVLVLIEYDLDDETTAEQAAAAYACIERLVNRFDFRYYFDDKLLSPGATKDAIAFFACERAEMAGHADDALYDSLDTLKRRLDAFLVGYDEYVIETEPYASMQPYFLQGDELDICVMREINPRRGLRINPEITSEFTLAKQRQEERLYRNLVGEIEVQYYVPNPEADEEEDRAYPDVRLELLIRRFTNHDDLMTHLKESLGYGVEAIFVRDDILVAMETRLGGSDELKRSLFEAIRRYVRRLDLMLYAKHSFLAEDSETPIPNDTTLLLMDRWQKAYVR